MNKSEVIRNAMREGPSMSNRDIKSFLALKGTKVSTALVALVRKSIPRTNGQATQPRSHAATNGRAECPLALVKSTRELANRIGRVKEGATVLFTNYAGHEIAIKGEELTIIQESDILAVIRS